MSGNFYCVPCEDHEKRFKVPDTKEGQQHMVSHLEEVHNVRGLEDQLATILLGGVEFEE